VLELSDMTTPDGITIRRELRAGDLEAIADLHTRIYSREHAMEAGFVEDIVAALHRASESGWPENGGVHILEGGGEMTGTMAWTDEGDHARIRWVLLAPELRGEGLGRQLVEEMVDEIDARGYELTVLTTFSALRRAAAIYRSLGFVLVDSRAHDSWGPTVEMQRYERRR
jgi:GNAT superfamily N-acetyltransferase